ncbi:MAG TPA: hypothetical protein VKP69_27085 [Isosphaeraceae bacterium]|nr:hypothetical protein [Isosphaeraceae bacterium]
MGDDGRLGRQALDAAGAEGAGDPPVVRTTSATSAGSAIGPPWPRTITSTRTVRAASAMAWTRFAASARIRGALDPDHPLGHPADARERRTAPTSAVARASSLLRT